MNSQFLTWFNLLCSPDDCKWESHVFSVKECGSRPFCQEHVSHSQPRSRVLRPLSLPFPLALLRWCQHCFESLDNTNCKNSNVPGHGCVSGHCAQSSSGRFQRSSYRWSDQRAGKWIHRHGAQSVSAFSLKMDGNVCLLWFPWYNIASGSPLRLYESVSTLPRNVTVMCFWIYNERKHSCS